MGPHACVQAGEGRGSSVSQQSAVSPGLGGTTAGPLPAFPGGTSMRLSLPAPQVSGAPGAQETGVS